MNSLEKILAYQNIKPFLNKNDWVDLGKKLDIDDESLKRTWGKNVEDSFFLIAQTYESVDRIISFSEGVSKLTDTPSADGLIVLKNGDRLLVEIKASKDNEWRITKNRLNKQKELAQKIGINLFYAVALNGYWGLFTSLFVENNNYRIKFPRDLKSSQFDLVFDARLVKIPKGLRIIKYYSPNKKDEALVLVDEPDYGYLFKYQLQYENKLINFDKEIQLVLLTAIEAAIFKNYKVDKISEDTIRVIHACNEDIVTYDFNLVMEPIYRTINSTTNDFFDSSSFIIHALDKLQSIGTLGLQQAKQDSINFLTKMKANGIPFSIIKTTDVDELNYKI